MAILRWFRLNFAYQIEKILCYDWFPNQEAESELKANAGKQAHSVFPKPVAYG